MGTRADFYIKTNKGLTWLGSIGWDGYVKGIPKTILNSKDKEEFKASVSRFLKRRKDATHPKEGWPWPWETSKTTDYTYIFDRSKVYICHFSYCGYSFEVYKQAEKLYKQAEKIALNKGMAEPEMEDFLKLQRSKVFEFPDMSSIQNISFGPNSGLIFF